MGLFGRKREPPFPVEGGRIPDSRGQADDEIGVAGPPWNMKAREAMALDRKTDKLPPFRTPVYSRRYIQRGISQGMSVEGMRETAPMIPLPIRSSLAQVVHVNRVQISKYVSWIRPFGMAPGYPTAKVRTLINTSSRIQRRPTPRINRPGGAPAQPRVRDSGAMGSPRRFTKALPVSLNDYSPPVYGE